MISLNNPKYKMSREEMLKISGGTKQWVFICYTKIEKVPCPDTAREVHPNATCYETESLYYLYNSFGKIVDQTITNDQVPQK